MTYQENKLNRVSAYRQLQGLSHQLSLLTRGNYTLDNFAVPEGVSVSPVKSGEQRFSRWDSAINSWRAGVKHINDHGEAVESFILPTNTQWWRQLPLLVLQLDQGKIGAAGAANLGL